MSKPLLYPERQRCKKCRLYLGGFAVLKRLYCSYDCAGVAMPSENPDDWPRQHFARYKGRKTAKIAYDYPEQPDERKQRFSDLVTYLCEYCLMYHLGHEGVQSND